jgi:hypothetical protein
MVQFVGVEAVVQRHNPSVYVGVVAGTAKAEATSETKNLDEQKTIAEAKAAFKANAELNISAEPKPTGMGLHQAAYSWVSTV